MNYLKKNLSILSRNNLSLVQLIEKLEIASYYQIVKAKNNYPALLYTDSNIKYYLSSAYNPEKQAKNILSYYGLPDRGIIVLLGDSLGYLIQEINKQLTHRHKFIVIIHDPSIFKLMLINNDLTPVLQNQQIEWLIDKNIEDVQEYMLKNCSGVFPQNLMVIHHPAIERLNPDYYSEASKMIFNVCSTKSSEYLTLTRMGNRFRENNLNNIKLIVKHPHVNVLKDMFKDRPAVLVAAGPSLDKNIHILKQNQDKVLIICVLTALKKLIDYGITPHLIASIDPTEMIGKYLENTRNDLPLVADMECSYKVLENYKGPIFLWPSDKPINKWINNCNKNFIHLKKGATVSHLVFFIGELLGCNPLIMVGHDLAYTDNKAHADGCNTVWGNNEQKGNIQIRSWDDKTVGTFGGFLAFLTLFEQIIRNTNRKVIDATEGGAYKEGTERITLQEAIERHCAVKLDIGNTIDVLYKNSERIKELILKEQIKTLITNAKESYKLLENISDESNKIIKASKNKREIQQLNKMMQKVISGYNSFYNSIYPRTISEILFVQTNLYLQSFYTDDYKEYENYIERSKLYKLIAKNFIKDFKYLENFFSKI